jgi:hypothetical protein
LHGVTDEEYGVLLRHEYKFCERASLGTGKSGNSHFTSRAPSHKKNRCDARALLKIKEELVYEP